MRPCDTFTSSDRFERITRAEVAESLSEHLRTPVSPEDDRLTDELCYEYVNLLSQTGDPKECWEEMEADEDAPLKSFKTAVGEAG